MSSRGEFPPQARDLAIEPDVTQSRTWLLTHSAGEASGTSILIVVNVDVRVDRRTC